MAKLEIPVVVDISEIESLIDEIKHLQTYKLSTGDEQILVDRDLVVRIFVDHVRANIKPEKGKWIKISPAGIYECSECGRNVMTADIEAYEFCHGCGAKMEEGDPD